MATHGNLSPPDPARDFEESEEEYHTVLRGSTTADRADMSRMGKAQELRRNYRPLSALAFTVILQATWEILMLASNQALVDGGPAGLIWSFVWTWLGFGTVILSLAEMSSMAPTAGGQYHWVSEFSPPHVQKRVSFFIGWISTLSWQAGTATGPFLVGTLIQASIALKSDHYSPTNWQGTLMVIAVTISTWAFNIWGTSMMPVFQNIMLVLHVFGFWSIIVVFWVLSPRATPVITFSRFVNRGGWGSTGLALMVGQLSAIFACTCASLSIALANHRAKQAAGSDSAAHMSEEIKDASKTVPRTMVGSYILNGILGIVFLITYMFVITDVDAALNHPSGYPHIWAFGQAVSPSGVVVLNTIPIMLLYAGTLTFNLSTSRQTWAFARDRGLPFSNWIGHVHPTLQVPANATTLTCLFTIGLCLINLGSKVAFNAIVSLNIVAVMLTYLISIGAVLYRRVYHPELLPACRWSLGRWGILVNTCGILYSFHAFFWSFWPQGTPVALETFNWAVVIFTSIVLLSFVDYALRGRYHYLGPVVFTQGFKGD